MGVHEWGIYNERESSAARENAVGWRVIQRLLKQDWGHANVVWDHTSKEER